MIRGLTHGETYSGRSRPTGPTQTSRSSRACRRSEGAIGTHQAPISVFPFTARPWLSPSIPAKQSNGALAHKLGPLASGARTIALALGASVHASASAATQSSGAGTANTSFVAKGLDRSVRLRRRIKRPAVGGRGRHLVTSRLEADAQRRGRSGLGGDAPWSPETQHVRDAAAGDVDRPGEPGEPAGVRHRG